MRTASANNCKLVKFVGQIHQDRMVATGSSAHEARKKVQRIAWLNYTEVCIFESRLMLIRTRQLPRMLQSQKRFVHGCFHREPRDSSDLHEVSEALRSSWRHIGVKYGSCAAVGGLEPCWSGKL